MSSRRKFIKQNSLATFSFLIGTKIVFGANLKEGIIPIALQNFDDPYSLKGKHKSLTILNDKPINAETPVHLLNDKITPNDKFFVRNNGIPPRDIEVDKWKLTIDGESANSKTTFTIAELKKKFKTYQYQLVLECGGNGRSEFVPPAKGNQWSLGAVGCALFTGVRLKDVLEYVGYRSNAKYIGYYGKDTHISGDPDKVVISRGVPISKALENHSLIAWAMNDQPIPLHNGFPLRLVFGGWPASTSGKWLHKISIRNKVHDGPKMTGQSYRVPCKTVAPGTKVDDSDMCIIESMPVKSLITYPKTGATISQTENLLINGHSWAGENEVATMQYSIDFGATWQNCKLEKPANKYAWQHFSAQIKFPESGYYEVWAKATDNLGKSQPMVLPNWNPRGYLNNACHRIAIMVK